MMYGVVNSRFEATLPAAEKLEIAAEIWKRTIDFDFPALTDEDLILNAEELFLALDYREEDEHS
jgi:hypothetical protein